MSSQLTLRNKSASQTTGPVLSPQYTDRKCGKTILRVLKAPSLGASAMWKAQAFDHTRSRLRGMLNDSITVDEAIAFIGEHFPLGTMVA